MPLVHILHRSLSICSQSVGPPVNMNDLAVNIDILFLNHRDSLIRAIFGIVGCPQTAEDLAHSAYLKMLHALENQEVAYPKPFLYQIAKNLALDHLRKENVSLRSSHTLEDEHDGQYSLVDSLPACWR